VGVQLSAQNEREKVLKRNSVCGC